MPESDLFPRLALVPSSAIRFHERPERRRTVRLTERLRNEAFLRNPPIVAEMGDERFLLLDGANRVAAFMELGLSHVPARSLTTPIPESSFEAGTICCSIPARSISSAPTMQLTA